MRQTNSWIKSFFIIIACLIPTSLRAQVPEIQLLSELPERFNSGVIKFAGAYNQYINAIHLSSSSIEYIQIDTTNQEIAVFDQFPKAISSTEIQQVVQFNEEIHLFGYLSNRKEISIVRCRFPIESPDQIITDTVIQLNELSYFDKLQYEWISDENHGLVFLYLNDKVEKNSIQFTKFHPDGSTHSDSLPILEFEDWEDLAFFFHSSGVLSMLSPKIDNVINGSNAYHFYASNLKKPISIQFDQLEQIEDLSMAEVTDSSILITGIKKTRNSRKREIPNPIFLAEYQFQEQKIVICTKIENNSDFKPKPNYYSYFKFRDIIPLSDGGFIWVGEQYEKIARSRTFGSISGFERTNMSDLTINYYYNDLLIIRYNKKLERQWARTIYKNQVSTNDAGIFSSYLLQVFENSIQFIFNENINKKANIVAVNVYKNGTTKKIELNAVGDIGNQYMFRFGHRIGYLSTVMPVKGKRRNSLYMINY